MPLIKRYSNCKLYDTDSKRYVTLEDVAEFIRNGEEVRVVDHSTGEDLTSVTLMQVLFEEEKKIGGLLPQVYLSRLIRTGGDAISALRSRLVSLDPFQVVDDEIRKRVQSLVEHDRLSAEEGQRIMDLLIQKAPQADVVHIPVRGEAQEAPAAEGTEQPVPVEPAPEPEAEPTADPEEVDALLRQVQALEQELARLQQAGSTDQEGAGI